MNAHTYLTTWLSSCPVRIFSRSHPLIVKIQSINKVSALKWTTLKSTHIMWYLEHGYFVLIGFELISTLYFLAPLHSCFYLQAISIPPILSCHLHFHNFYSLSTLNSMFEFLFWVNFCSYLFLLESFVLSVLGVFNSFYLFFF